MKRIVIIVSSLLLFTTGLYAQDGRRPGGAGQQKNRGARMAQGGDRGDRIHAIKVGYLTDRLQLSSSQATAFWPVYNEYERELRTARQAFRQKYRQGPAGESNDQAVRYIEDNLDFQEQAIDIKRKYKDRLLKTITPQQLASLYEAERDFKKLLLKQLKERRGGR